MPALRCCGSLHAGRSLRPGGVQSGPALMALADLAMYAAVMGLYGNEPRVLSSDLSMNFLRRAPNQALLGRCSVLGLDVKRALAKTEIVPRDRRDGRMICLVTANYSLALAAASGSPAKWLPWPIANNDSSNRKLVIVERWWLPVQRWSVKPDWHDS